MSKKAIPQSAVIPFRIKDEQVQILLITTSRGRRWIVPKGMLEKKLTPAKSAAKEAEEEAGVSGKVYSDCVGFFRYQKGKDTCDIAVFPLRVNKVQRDWDEADRRERMWLPASKAARKVRHRELSAMIARLPRWVRKNTELLNS